MKSAVPKRGVSHLRITMAGIIASSKRPAVRGSGSGNVKGKDVNLVSFIIKQGKRNKSLLSFRCTQAIKGREPWENPHRRDSLSINNVIKQYILCSRLPALASS